MHYNKSSEKDGPKRLIKVLSVSLIISTLILMILSVLFINEKRKHAEEITNTRTEKNEISRLELIKAEEENTEAYYEVCKKLKSSFNPANGALIFKTKCASCHSEGNKQIIGLGLQNVLERSPSIPWIIGFMENPDSTLKIKSKYNDLIIAEMEELNIEHPHPKQLVNKYEIYDVLGYLGMISE